MEEPGLTLGQSLPPCPLCGPPSVLLLIEPQSHWGWRGETKTTKGTEEILFKVLPPERYENPAETTADWALSCDRCCLSIEKGPPCRRWSPGIRDSNCLVDCVLFPVVPASHSFGIVSSLHHRAKSNINLTWPLKMFTWLKICQLNYIFSHI